MFKIIKSVSVWVFLLGMVSLQAKEYPELYLGVTSVHGPNIGRWERNHFLDGLERELARRGDITLASRAPFLLEVRISGYSKNFSRAQGKFLGSTQYRFKKKVRLDAQYIVFDRNGYELYQGTLPYNVSMDTGSSISYADAMRRARENMFEGIGERMGLRINDRFHFMVDFERQLDERYGKPKHRSQRKSYKKTASNTVTVNQALDFEKNRLGRKNSASDFTWEGLLGKNDMHFFRPLNKASFAVVKGKSYKNIDRRYIKRKKLSGGLFMVLDGDRSLKKGTILVFKTTEGHYGKLLVLGFKSKGAVSKYAIRLKWTLF